MANKLPVNTIDVKNKLDIFIFINQVKIIYFIHYLNI